MKNPLTQIVENEVKKQYVTEKAFYTNVLNTTQQTWNNWKRGDRGLSDEKFIIISRLFTEYEWMIVKKLDTDMRMFSNNFKDEPVEVYNQTRKAIAKQWAELGASIYVNSARNVDDSEDGRRTPGTEVLISMDYNTPLINSRDSIKFYTTESSGHIKAGKENRKKWVVNNIDKLI